MRSLQINKKSLVIVALLACILGMGKESKAQLNPFGASYFQNQFLMNPALTGLHGKWNLNAGYRREWNSLPDAPNSQYLTAEYGFSNKFNLGLNIQSDKAGVLRTTSAMATYAYFLPLSGNGRRLHFGLNAGVINRQIDNSALNGDQDDIALSNAARTKFDGGLGVAYTDKRFTVQASAQDLVSYTKKEESDLVDRSTFFAAVSYRLLFENGIELEPKVAFRGIKGYDNIIDAGANLSFSEGFSVFGLYHTSKNATAGASLIIKKLLRITAIYTTEPPELKSYTDGKFEIGVGFLLDRK